MVNAVLKRRASDCLLWAPRCCAPMKSRSVERCAPCVRVFMEIFVADVKPRLWPLLLKSSKDRLVYYSSSVLMTGRARWLTASCRFNSGRFHVVTRKHAFGFPNGFWDWCRLPRLIIPSRITPKRSSPPVERGPRMSWMCPRSGGRRRGVLRARPAVQIQIGDWLFSLSCGVGLRYIRHTEVWRSLPLWLFGLVLRPCPWVTLLGGWATAAPPPPPVPSHSLKAGSVWDGRHGALGHTKSLLTWKPGAAFYHVAPRGPCFISALISSSSSFFFTISERCVCFRPGHCCDSGAEVTAPSDGLGSEFKYLPLSAPFRRPFHSSLPAFMKSAPCIGISSSHHVVAVDAICSLVP